ncbi:MAG: hypothetical protein RIT02_2631 [Planctomycetota bacterium]|jgi:hypothetical protein
MTTETTTTTPETEPEKLGTMNRRAQKFARLEDWKPTTIERLVASDIASKHTRAADQLRGGADAGWLVAPHYAIAEGSWDRYSLGKLMAGDRLDAGKMIDWLRDCLTEGQTEGQDVLIGLPTIDWTADADTVHNGAFYTTFSGQFLVPILDLDGQHILNVNARRFLTLDKHIRNCTGYRATADKLYWMQGESAVAVLMSVGEV